MIHRCVILTANPCDNHRCPTGSICRVFKPTCEAYCEPSCNIDNGGCPNYQSCSLQVVRCKKVPCPRVVKCTPSESTNHCIIVSVLKKIKR